MLITIFESHILYVDVSNNSENGKIRYKSQLSQTLYINWI